MSTPTYSFSEYPCRCPEARMYRQAVTRRDRAGIRPMRGVPEALDTIRNVYLDNHRITSVLPCGACETQVEVVHPITPEQFDALPDTSWVRCTACAIPQQVTEGSTVGGNPTVDREVSRPIGLETQGVS